MFVVSRRYKRPLSHSPPFFFVFDRKLFRDKGTLSSIVAFRPKPIYLSAWQYSQHGGKHCCNTWGRFIKERLLIDIRDFTADGCGPYKTDAALNSVSQLPVPPQPLLSTRVVLVGRRTGIQITIEVLGNPSTSHRHVGCRWPKPICMWTPSHILTHPAVPYKIKYYAIWNIFSYRSIMNYNIK